MFTHLLREQLDRIPAEKRDSDLDDALREYARVIAQLVGTVSEARRETTGDVKVSGLELVVSEALDLAEDCADTPAYEELQMSLYGLVAGLAGGFDLEGVSEDD